MKEAGKCNFDVNGCCYALACYSDIMCGAKNDKGEVVCMATMEEIKERSRLIGMMPKMTVMAPTVENVSNPPDENVASQEIVEYDYMEEVGNLLDSMSAKPEALTDEDIIMQVMEERNKISEITSHVVKTGLFIDSKERYVEFLDHLLELPTDNERIKQAWLHFLTKICDAPTRIHMRGVVILCLPALNYMITLPDEENVSKDPHDELNIIPE